MNANFKEAAGGPDIIDQMVAGGWKIGELGRSVGWTPVSYTHLTLPTILLV